MSCSKCFPYYKVDVNEKCVHRGNKTDYTDRTISVFEKELISSIIQVFVKAKIPKDLRRLLLCRIVVDIGIYEWIWLTNAQKSAYDRWLASRNDVSYTDAKLN